MDFIWLVSLFAVLAHGKKTNMGYNFTEFLKYEEVMNYLNHLEQSHPKMIKVMSIGESYEKRKIPAVQICSGKCGKKKAVLIDGGIHAREWISPTTVLYLIHQLVEHREENKEMLKNLDWLIAPLVNPDGYVYSHTKDRMWRKNRQPPPKGKCIGVDLNRNFDFKWIKKDDKCAEDYGGSKPFSEKESQALKKFAEDNGSGERIVLYITVHSFGQHLTYPWGYTLSKYSKPDNMPELKAFADKCQKAIRDFNGTRYTTGTAADLISPAPGSDDYMKAVQKIALSYTFELPGGGKEGFDPPPSMILPVAKETFQCFKTAVPTILT